MITQIIKAKKRGYRAANRAKGRLSQTDPAPSFGLSVRLLAKIFRLSPNKITQLKRDASKKGYLHIAQRPMQRISFIHAKALQQSDKLFIKIGNQFYFKEYDQIEPQLPFKRKNKHHVFFASKSDNDIIRGY